MNRMSVLRKRRKELYKLADNVKEYALKEDLDGGILPRREWGWCVEAEVNGYRVCSPDSNQFEAVQAALDTVKWAMTLPPCITSSKHIEATEEALEGE